MKKTNIIVMLSLVVTFLFACTSPSKNDNYADYKKGVAKIEKDKYSPKPDTLNQITEGTIVYFVQNITEGIDRSRYPAAEIKRELDSSYFKFINQPEINNGANGGNTAYYTFYKAIKKGKTIIVEKIYEPKAVETISADGKKQVKSTKVDTKGEPTVTNKYEFIIN
jgi:hypothetical protein